MRQNTVSKHSRKVWGPGVLCISLVIGLAGCASTLDKAKRSATISEQVYTKVNAETVSQIAAIVEKHRTGTVSDDDRKRLVVLNELRKTLDNYADAHNAYVEGLKLWEQTQKRPSNFEELSTHMLSLVQAAQSLGKQANIRIR